MGHSIWKFPLKDTIDQVVEMPAGAVILSAQMQRHGQRCVPTIWAMVDTDKKPEPRKFHIVGTGWDMFEFEGEENQESVKYLATLQDNLGFVWHIFERLKS